MLLDCASFKTKTLYHLLTAIVAPRPIAWVSTRGMDGTSNLAPFSFFNLFCIAPPVLGFAPGYKDAKKFPKDTLRNIQATGEFTVNFVDENLLSAMNETSIELPQDMSEFTYTNLEAAPGASSQCLRVKAAKVSLECTLRQIIDLGGSALVLGNIQHLHIQDDLLQEALLKKEEKQRGNPVQAQEEEEEEEEEKALPTLGEDQTRRPIQTEQSRQSTVASTGAEALGDEAEQQRKDNQEPDLELLKRLLLTGEIELDATILRPVGRLGGNQYLTLTGLEDHPRPTRR